MRPLRTVAALLLTMMLFSGCAASSKIREFGAFDARLERDAVYVIPFDATLVPPDFGEPVFNEFVDRLNDQRRKTRVANFLILKEDLKSVDPAWLINQTYISGDIWGFVETSGCCSTEMKVKSRIYLYEPGKNEPSLEVFVPEGDFFDHDRVSPAAAKARMGSKLARELAAAIVKKLSP